MDNQEKNSKIIAEIEGISTRRINIYKQYIDRDSQAKKGKTNGMNNSLFR